MSIPQRMLVQETRRLHRPSQRTRVSTNQKYFTNHTQTGGNSGKSSLKDSTYTVPPVKLWFWSFDMRWFLSFLFLIFKMFSTLKNDSNHIYTYIVSPQFTTTQHLLEIPLPRPQSRIPRRSRGNESMQRLRTYTQVHRTWGTDTG